MKGKVFSALSKVAEQREAHPLQVEDFDAVLQVFVNGDQLFVSALELLPGHLEVFEVSLELGYLAGVHCEAGGGGEASVVERRVRGSVSDGRTTALEDLGRLEGALLDLCILGSVARAFDGEGAVERVVAFEAGELVESDLIDGPCSGLQGLRRNETSVTDVEWKKSWEERRTILLRPCASASQARTASGPSR